jgi:hypothetical protein
VRSLRPYQIAAISRLSAYTAEGHRTLGLNMPTGSGKSVVLAALLAQLRAEGRFRGAVVGVPSDAIELNFDRDVDITADPAHVVGREAMWLRLREGDDKRAELDALLSGAGSAWAALTTHEQLRRESKAGTLDRDLAGCVLVLDEAHHAGTTEDGGVTHIGDVAHAWTERGGTVLLATATPFRGDGASVFPDETKAFVWPIAEHSVSGYAPNDFQIETAILTVEATTSRELAGETLPKAEAGGDSAERMVAKWVADGRPKAVFIVPAKGSLRWAARLAAALEAASARVVDAVGKGDEVKRRLSDALVHEQGVKRFEDSRVDVILACKRFDEGTDWALCSHVYNYGIPGSFGLTIQRWGRAFRSKAGVEGYPAEHRETAKLTCFVPRVSAEVLDKFEKAHHDHALLLAVFMADFEVAREFVKVDRLRGYMPAGERPEQEEAPRVSDTARVKVLAKLVRYEHDVVEATGTAPTVAEARAYLDALELPPDEQVAAEQVLTSWATIGRKRRASVVAAKTVFGELVRDDARDRWDPVADDYEHHTLAVADAVTAIYSGFTGRDAAEVAARLRGTTEKPDLTEEMIREAARKFFEEHGRWPTQKDGDATRYFGFPETWASVNNAAHTGIRGLNAGTSLPSILGRTKAALEPVLMDACAAFRVEHGRWPTRKDGDATKYFGFPITWLAVDLACRTGGRGLSGQAPLRERLGAAPLPPRRQWDDRELNDDMVRDAAYSFRDRHGRFPTQKDGDASEYFGFPISWSAVNSAARVGRRGLIGGSSLSLILGRQSALRLSDDNIAIAIERFHADHDRPPRTKDGDASGYFGFLITWLAVDAFLKKRGSTLRAASGERARRIPEDVLTQLRLELERDSKSALARKFGVSIATITKLRAAEGVRMPSGRRKAR